MSSADFEKLIDSYLDGELDAEQVAEFEIYLREDLTRLDQLLRASYIHRCIQNSFESEFAIDVLTLMEGQDDQAAEMLRDMRVLEGGGDDVESLVDLTDVVRRQKLALADSRAKQKRNSKAEKKKTHQMIVIPKSGFYGVVAAIAALVFLVVLPYMQDLVLDVNSKDDVVVAPVMVAEVTGLVDVVYGGGRDDYQRGMKLASHDICFKKGLMRLRFGDGAEVILEGPVNFSLDTVQGGTLKFGRLTSYCPKGAEGFTIRTLDGKVVDLGTEFGVETHGFGVTDVHVFEGRLMTSRFDEMGKPTASLEMALGQTVRINVNTKQMSYEDLSVDHYVREMRRSVDLVDMVAGGDGFGGGKSMGLDPLNGELMNEGPRGLNWNRVGNHAFNRVLISEYIAGIFVPDGRDGEVQIDPSGGVYGGFRETDNKGYSYVWAGGDVPLPNVAGVPQVFDTVVDGVDYGDGDHQMLGINANVGFTFDLKRIAKDQEGMVVKRLSAKCIARYDMFDKHNTGAFSNKASHSMDLLVLVDGKLRFSKMQFNSEDGSFDVSVKLLPSDRYLTFAVTDGGNGNGTDWLLIGDPKIDFVLE